MCGSISAFANDSKNAAPLLTEESPSLWEKAKKAGSRVIDQGKEAVEATSQKLDLTKNFRDETDWTLLGTYSLIDTWIPSKYGATFVYVPSVDASWEVEYLRGSVSFEFFIKDLGKMTDEKLSIIRRFYADRNSFNFFLGGGYSAFSIHLGDRLTSLVSGGAIPNVDLVTLRSLGLIAGLGNRWQFEGGWTIGMDWFSIFVPVKNLEAEAPYVNSSASESGKKDVRDVMSVIQHVPTFAIFKFQVGYSF